MPGKHLYHLGTYLGAGVKNSSGTGNVGINFGMCVKKIPMVVRYRAMCWSKKKCIPGLGCVRVKIETYLG